MLTGPVAPLKGFEGFLLISVKVYFYKAGSRLFSAVLAGMLSSTACNFGWKERHRRSECRALDKWKREVAENSKRKGLPPFVAYSQKPVAAVDPEPTGERPPQETDYVGLDGYDAGSLEWGCMAVELGFLRRLHRVRR